MILFDDGFDALLHFGQHSVQTAFVLVKYTVFGILERGLDCRDSE